jgi:hypothetical protein
MRCAVAAATPATMRVGAGPGHPGEVEEPQDVPVGDGAGDVDGLGEGLAEVEAWRRRWRWWALPDGRLGGGRGASLPSGGWWRQNDASALVLSWWTAGAAQDSNSAPVAGTKSD